MKPLTFSQVNVEEPSATVAGVFTVVDGIIFTIIFILVCIIAWLSNREIRISRAQMAHSEKILKNERNSLERRISERTVAFVRAEEQRMIELQRNAEFGKLSQGLFHDLMSPLSSISLFAEKNELGDVVNASRRINSFMESIKRSLGDESLNQIISITKPENINSKLQHHSPSKSIKNTKELLASDLRHEIEIVRDILGYKARMNNVYIKIKMHPKDNVILNIHPVRLHQLILNLVSNSIEACSSLFISDEKTKDLEHSVIISVVKNNKNIELSVSDTGCGISIENQERMFIDRFTTKSDGNGIGLMTIKNIVKQDLKGMIEVNSKEKNGTTLKIIIPNNPNKI